MSERDEQQSEAGEESDAEREQGGDDAPRSDSGEEDEEDRESTLRREARELGDEAGRDLNTLQQGSSVHAAGARIPVRMLGAISIFIGGFVAAYLLCWSLLGDIGLAVGLFVGAAVGIIGVKLFASLHQSDESPSTKRA